MAELIEFPLLVYLFAILAGFTLLGTHRAILAIFTRPVQHGSAPPCSGQIATGPPAGGPAPPRITIQVPLFNEPTVAARVIRAVAAIDYPPDRLEIQVLDDSTDRTSAIVSQTIDGIRAEMGAGAPGLEHLRRDRRDGFKAGALAAGLARATGTFIAIFDADFIPPPEFLRRTLPFLEDPRVAVVQARWTHLNRTQSLLTRVQALTLDAHFVAEQAVRAAGGRWLTFNGTAGVWRRSAIDDAGGWLARTLTEDADLSYRAQLRGHRILFLPGLEAPAELPTGLSAWVGQQRRWTTGLVQNAMLLARPIVSSPAPWRIRLEAMLHLLAPLAYPLLVGLVLVGALAALLGYTPIAVPRSVPLAACWISLAGGCVATAAWLLRAQRALGRPVLAQVPVVVATMMLGIGLAWQHTTAVIRAVRGRPGDFLRTPKVGTDAPARGTARRGNHGAGSPRLGSRAPRVARGSVECVLGMTAAAAAWAGFSAGHAIVSPVFLSLFAVSFLGVGVALLRDSRAAGPPYEASTRTVRVSPAPSAEAPTRAIV